MHTFRPSRRRVLFDVFCALGIAACFAGGWIETGAWAFLPAAAIAALCGLVHAFDLAGHELVLSADQGAVVPSAVSQEGKTVNTTKAVELVEPEAPPAVKPRKPKAPRKPRKGRKTVEGQVTQPVPPQEGEVTLDLVPAEEEVDLGELPDEMAHIPLVPLFEPEPFVRQQRAVFGRKAG